MFSELAIFRSKAPIPGLYDSLMGGAFLWKGVGIALQLCVLGLTAAALIAAYRATFQKERWSQVLSQVFPVLALATAALLLVQPWDELFVNLRHSVNFVEAGRFSFNQTSDIEGTVDFLPYFFLGVLNKLGFPLLEMAFLQSLLGSLLCIWAGRALLMAWGFPSARYWAPAVLSLSGPLLLNLSTGFSTTLFSAVILWSIFHCLYGRPLLGVFLLALVPLIRIEGGWFTVLMGFYLLKQTERTPRNFALTALTLLPLLLLSLWRWKTFGSPIPVPVQYKATLGDLFFLAVGLRNLGTDLIATHTLFWLATIFLVWSSTAGRFSQALWMEGLLLVFVLPYYSSGGDWFPPAWGRYLFPFLFFSLLLGIACLAHLLTNAPEQPARNCLVGTIILIFVLHQLPSYGAYHRLTEYVFSARRILGDVTLKKKRRMNYRIYSLSQLGEHLRRSTLPTDVLGTSEIATVSYFSKRETLDFLGLANPEVAHRPLRPHPTLVQMPNEETDLPHLIFKRVHPELLGKYRPQYLYLFDLTIPDIFKDVPFEEWDDDLVSKAFSRWQKSYKKLVKSLYGGFEKIAGLGYRPIVVCYSNDHCSLYFAAQEVYPRHTARLRELGLTGRENFPLPRP